MSNITFDWHAAPLSMLEKRFGTDLGEGLSARVAHTKLENEKKENKGKKKSLFTPVRKSAVSCLLCYLATPYVILLLIVSLATAFFGSVLLGLAVFFVAFGAALFGGFLNLRAVRRLESIGEYASPMVRVKRGGHLFYTDGRNVVSGDLIYLSAGDLLPCDVRLVKSHDLTVDELYYTGRSIGKRSIKKDAEVILNPVSPLSEAGNMLFAGSAVMEGNAVGLVCATGDEVLLSPYIADGALSGKDSDPEGVQKLRNPLRIITFISGCALLVLSLLGLLTLRGKVSPIYVFMLLLSAFMFLMGQLLSHSAKETAVAYMSRLSSKKNKKDLDRSAAVRNIKTFDALSSITDLILLGKAGFQVGTHKIDRVYTAYGTEDGLPADTKIGTRLLHRIYIYIKAIRESGVRTSFYENGYADALASHLRDCKFDRSGADLEIKSIYFASDSRYGYACAESESRIDRVALTFDDRVIGDCRSVYDGGAIREMTEGERQAMLLFRSNAASKGRKCLYVISEQEGRPVFEAILTLYLPTDPHITEAVENLSNLRIKTTTLLSYEDAETGKLISDPSLSTLFADRIALASEFRRNKKDILTGLGSYSVYVGFENIEYETLIEEIQKRGGKVAAYGVDNSYNSVMACADVAISADMLNYEREAHRDAVYEKMPPEGRDSNLRASQQTRLLSKVIVKRPHGAGGGLTAIHHAVIMSRRAYLSFTQTLLLFSFLISGLVTFNIMSILTGTLFLDAWQTVSFSAVGSFMSITIFIDAEQKKELISARRDFTSYPTETYLSRLPSIICRIAAVVILTSAVKILEICGVFGDAPAYKLPICLCLLLTSFAEVFLLNHQYTVKGEGRRVSWLKFLSAYALLLSLCAVATQEPFSDTFFKNGFGTKEHLIVPAYIVLYIIALSVANLIEKARKKR